MPPRAGTPGTIPPRRRWPRGNRELAQILPTPRHFEQAAPLVTEELLAEEIPRGPNPERHLAAIRACADTGCDEVHVSRIGPDQEGFPAFSEREILPRSA